MDEMEEGRDYKDYLNPDSMEILTECYVEPSLGRAEEMDRFQFLRHGYFCVDYDSVPGSLVFNRIVSLKDTWAKIQEKN